MNDHIIFNHGQMKYCSVDRMCAQCDKTFKVRPCEVRTRRYKYCSMKCRKIAKAFGTCKLTLNQVSDIRENYMRYKTPLHFYATRFGVNPRTIWSITNNKSWNWS